MSKNNARWAQASAEPGAETGAGEQAGVQVRPLRYVNTNYVITGVPARDLSADEAAKYGPTIAAAQAAGRVVIYQEVE